MNMLFYAIIDSLDHREIGQLTALIGNSGSSDLCPHELYSQLVTFCFDHDIEIPKVYADIDTREVKVRLGWQTLEIGGIHFVEE